MEHGELAQFESWQWSAMPYGWRLVTPYESNVITEDRAFNLIIVRSTNEHQQYDWESFDEGWR